MLLLVWKGEVFYFSGSSDSCKLNQLSEVNIAAGLLPNIILITRIISPLHALYEYPVIGGSCLSGFVYLSD